MLWQNGLQSICYTQHFDLQAFRVSRKYCLAQNNVPGTNVSFILWCTSRLRAIWLRVCPCGFTLQIVLALLVQVCTVLRCCNCWHCYYFAVAVCRPSVVVSAIGLFLRRMPPPHTTWHDDLGLAKLLNPPRELRLRIPKVLYAVILVYCFWWWGLAGFWFKKMGYPSCLGWIGKLTKIFRNVFVQSPKMSVAQKTLLCRRGSCRRTEDGTSKVPPSIPTKPSLSRVARGFVKTMKKP